MRKKGISLIVLVITIIVLIILAGTVILTLSNNNPVESAEEATFKSNVAEYKSELSLWILSETGNKTGDYDYKKLNADNTYAKYGDTSISEGATIKTIIASMKTGDLTKFVIQQGELVYVGDINSDIAKEAGWATQVDVKIDVDLQAPQEAIIAPTVNDKTITATITISDDKEIDFTKSKYIITNSEEVIDEKSNIWESPQASAITESPFALSYTAPNEGRYFIHVLSVDKTGNRKTSVSSPLEVIQYAFTDPGYVTTKGVNGPVLNQGMKAVKWNASTKTWNEVANPSTDTSWYDYTTSNRQWANAQTADGSLWVWIPRYIYKIASGWHSNSTGTIEIQFSKGIDDNWNNSAIGNINTATDASASNKTWTNHPGFKFGDKELTGIWVAKFIATAREGIGNTYELDNVTTKHVKIQPGVTAWNDLYIGTMFTACRNMETDTNYGWNANGRGIDTHLIKNVEWGIVAYLSNSAYGYNPTYGTASYDVAGTGTTPTAFADNIYQSTTANVYGIYDMSSATAQFVAAYVSNVSINNEYSSSLVAAEEKYKDVYPSAGSRANNYAKYAERKGDAIYEITSTNIGRVAWNSDIFDTPLNNFFYRGGSSGGGSDAGIFVMGSYGGYNMSGYGLCFRPALVIGTGL